MSTSRTYTTGAVLTASQQNDLPQGTIGYAQAVANQATFTTVVDLTSLTVTVTLVAGRRIRITGQTLLGSSVADDVASLNIQEGATILQIANVLCRPISTGFVANTSVVVQPGAGSHTYKLTGVRASGTGNITSFAGATFPAYILVEDIGI